MEWNGMEWNGIVKTYEKEDGEEVQEFVLLAMPKPEAPKAESSRERHRERERKSAARGESV